MDINVAVLDIKNGRVDAFLLGLPVAYSKVKELGLKVALEFPLETSEDPAIVLPKGSDEMKQKLNEIIKEIKEDGTIKQLEDKWIKQQ
ncbi:MAG TPA: amino acid ABC transporter substrate-binding protein [Thermoanaerobacterales bacterium]|nr:amino acid ABC transporter substrate-binding protein [Thermoanaerobacterales bacterium]